mgnify:CR=1 FL=1
MSEAASYGRAQMITQNLSWTHRLAVDRAQRKFGELSKLCEQDRLDADLAYATLCELLAWARVVDEGFEVILEGKATDSGKSYEALRQASLCGQHMLAARWARNKTTHCLARPIAQGTRVEDCPRRAQSLEWLPAGDVFKDVISNRKQGAGLVEYERLFAGQRVVETLQPVIAWISEVRYDYRDSGWADNWFSHRQ